MGKNLGTGVNSGQAGETWRNHLPGTVVCLLVTRGLPHVLAGRWAPATMLWAPWRIICAAIMCNWLSWEVVVEQQQTTGIQQHRRRRQIHVGFDGMNSIECGCCHWTD